MTLYMRNGTGTSFLFISIYLHTNYLFVFWRVLRKRLVATSLVSNKPASPPQSAANVTPHDSDLRVRYFLLVHDIERQTIILSFCRTKNKFRIPRKYRYGLLTLKIPYNFRVSRHSCGLVSFTPYYRVLLSSESPPPVCVSLSDLCRGKKLIKFCCSYQVFDKKALIIFYTGQFVASHRNGRTTLCVTVYISRHIRAQCCC